MKIVKATSIVISLLYLLSLATGIAGAGKPAPRTPEISVKPAQTTAKVGQYFKINVTVSYVSDLVTWQFHLYFNPNILQAISISEGDFFATTYSTWFFPGFTDNTQGTIEFVSGTFLGEVKGLTGSKVVATIVFKAKAKGTSILDLRETLFLGPYVPSQGVTYISHIETDGTFTAK